MNKKLLIPLLVCFALIATAVSIYAQETPEEAAKKHGITFPIADLGNCADFSSCRTYCDDPVNQQTCMAFAKRKGFHKENKLDTRRQEMLNNAKAELGCDAEESCRAACHRQENFDKCSQFAKKHELSGGHKSDPGKQEIIQKAREILGCDSEAACRAVCEQETNRENCSRFAQKTGLRGGEQRVGPGGCNSQETCKAFCSDPNNFDKCSKFGGGGRREGGQPDGEPHRGGFRGPGGCDSEQSCRRYCENNPDQCKSFSSRRDEQPPGKPDHLPNEEQKRLCDENPDQCPFNRRGKEESREDFCRTNPQRCHPPQGERPVNQNPEEFCKNNPEKCQGRSEFPTEQSAPPAQEISPIYHQQPFPDALPPTQQVQGVATTRSIIQKIFDLISGLLN